MELLEDSHGVRVRLIGDILVFHHFERLVPATVRVIESARAKARAINPRVGMLIIAEAAAPTPDADARAQIAQIMKTNEGHITAMAQVVRGEGFGAAALRSALAGLGLLTRTAYPIKVFANIRDAVAWLVAKNGAPSSSAGPIAEVAEAFAAIPRPTTR